jgi:hypothetical protein
MLAPERIETMRKSLLAAWVLFGSVTLSGPAFAKDNERTGAACGVAKYILDHEEQFSPELVEKAEAYFWQYCAPNPFPGDGD